jgi:hypothetical protein
MNRLAAQLNFDVQPIRRLSALLCLALFLALQVFASSDALHQSLHADAGSSSHHCAITLLTGGQISVPILPVLGIALAAALLFSLPPVSLVALSSFDYRFSACRAPPRF